VAKIIFRHSHGREATPGLDDKDHEVTLGGDEGDEHEQKERDAYYVERRFGSFSRSVQLPVASSKHASRAAVLNLTAIRDSA
jgi:HSP20 family molecular chaperone IbpA